MAPSGRRTCLTKTGGPTVLRDTRPFRIHALALAVLLLVAGPDAARALEQPSGPVVVTIVGAISETNRGPFDEAEDEFFAYHEYRFEKAAAFDVAMLEAFGLHAATIAYDGWPAPIRFEGPRLKDLLDAVGATGSTVTAVALDGYAERIAWDELDRYDWILATRRDGHFMTIGRHGPAWLVYDRGAGHRYTADDEARWPWAVFLIVVE
jgi:hypothetical protein